MSEENSTEVPEVTDTIDQASVTPDSTQVDSTIVEESPSSVEQTVTETEKSEPTAVDFTETGNKVYDTLGKTLAGKGLDPQVYAQELAAQFDKGEGEVSLSEESFAELSKEFGEDMAKLMESQYISEYTTLDTTRKAKAEEVYGLFGGQEQLAHMTDTIMSEGKASKEDVDDLAEMLVGSKVKQSAAEKIIKEMYMSTEAFEQNPQLLEEGDTAQPTGIQPLSRREYTAQKMKAMSDGDSSAVERLNKRAQYTMENKSNLWK